MNRLRYFAAASIVSLTPGVAQAFDCAKASTAVEKAICASTGLKLQDDVLTGVYAGVRAASKTSESRMLALSQKRWIAGREQQCDGETGRKLDACISDDAERRISFLHGKPISGPGYRAWLMPVVIQQEGTNRRMDYDYTLLRFALPKTKAEKLLNEEMAKIMSEVKLGEDEEESEQILSSAVAATLTYASPKLISITLDLSDYEGGAHPNSGTNAMNIDMEKGAYVKGTDIFAEAARKDLTVDCKEQLLRQKRERGYGDGYDPKTDTLFSEATIAESMGDFGRWAIYAGKALVFFDAYEVGSYAEGPYECEFPMVRLKTLAVNPNPLP
jgi:uncharacterized protein YecT (DUF1311 family)